MPATWPTSARAAASIWFEERLRMTRSIALLVATLAAGQAWAITLAGFAQFLWLVFSCARAGMALSLKRLLKELPFKAGSAPTLFPADVADRHGASAADFDGRRVSPGVIAACAELRALARDELAEAERRLKNSDPAILPAFIPLAPLRLDLDRLDRNADHPFDAVADVSPLRRQWAVWRWARGR